jgi:hypothetical protein
MHSPEQNGLPKPETTLITTRSVAIGLILAIFLNVWVSYGTYILQTSRMSVGHLPISAFALFLLVPLIFNPIARWIAPGSVFTGVEQAIIFCILLISSLIPGKAFISYFLTIVSTPFYFAQPENQWNELFIPYLPPWLVASNSGNAMGFFYEGLPENNLIPWSPWIVPVIWWSSLFVALFFIGGCVSAIFRKQWVDYERLTFPLIQIPQELILHDQTKGKKWPDILYNRIFQLGFCLALTIAIWNMVSYWGWVPPLPIGSFLSPLQLDPIFPAIPLRINIYMLCFAYFINVEILLSIWAFFLLGILEIGILGFIGLNMGSSGPGGSGGVNAQFFGGFMMYVGYSLWTARSHIKSVVQKAFTQRPDIDDSKELLPYKTAFWGLLLGVLYVAGWLHQSGLSLPVIGVFLLFLFILYFGTTKIIAETGIMFLDLPVNAHHITVLTLGSGNLSKSSLTGLGLTSTFARNWRGMGMGSLILADKMTDGFLPKKKGLLLVLLLTFLVSMLSSITYTIYTGYTTTGAYNFGGGAFTSLNKSYYNDIALWMQNPLSLGQNEPWFMLSGALILVLLLKLRHWLLWWPLVPVGFAICFASTIRDSILSIFLAWLIKYILLKIGTITYQTGQRFFIGLLLGYTVGVVISFGVDAIFFPGQGHMMHDW